MDVEKGNVKFKNNQTAATITPRILNFPKRCAIDSPTSSGVRVTAEMGVYVNTLWEMPGPLVVVEDQGEFQGITWEPWILPGGETKADIQLKEDGWALGMFSPIARLKSDGRVRFFPHLFLAAATPCRYVYTNMPLIVENGPEQAFQWCQENNRQLGAIPFVRLDYRRHGIDPLSLAVLQMPPI